MKTGHKFAWIVGIVLAVSLGAYFLSARNAAKKQPAAAAALAPAAAEPPAETVAAKAATEGAKPGEWTMDLDAAKALATETGRPLLLNFTGSDWCGWCRMMDKQVFSQEAWQTYAKDRFVLVWIDFPRDKSLVPAAFAERNAKLLQEFEVAGFPTFILLDSDGLTRLGQAGASRDATPESFIATLEDILLASDKSVAALKDNMTDAQKAELDAAKEAKDMARQKLKDWVQAEPEQTDDNTALFDAMRDEVERADAAYLQLLKAAK